MRAVRQFPASMTSVVEAPRAVSSDASATRPLCAVKRTVDAFRTKVLRELKKIKLAWSELTYTTAPGVLILHPSTPVIAPVDHRQLAS